MELSKEMLMLTVSVMIIGLSTLFVLGKEDNASAEAMKDMGDLLDNESEWDTKEKEQIKQTSPVPKRVQKESKESTDREERTMLGHHCIEIKPVKLHASQKEIKAAIQPTTVLSKATETEIEIAALKSKLGWKHPIGLFGYSKDSKYKDLWIYFDLKDRSSPLNEVANRTFYMYGLDGAQCEPNWTIRGSAIVIRIEPDYNFSPDAKFVPLITIQEMYDTIVFFRDCKDSPRKIAIKRDSVRMMGSFAMNPPTAAGGMNMNAFMNHQNFVNKKGQMC